MTLHQLLPLVESSLSARGEPVRLRIEWVSSETTASQVARVRRVEGGDTLPVTLIVKAANAAFPYNPQEMLYNDWAALECLNAIGTADRIAPEFYTGLVHAKAPFIVMEDLGTASGSPYEVLDGDDADGAANALIEYAAALGRLHAKGAASREHFRQLRSGLPHPTRRRRLYHDPWSNAGRYSDQETKQAVADYLAVVRQLGVTHSTGAVEVEIESATKSVEEHEGEFLTLCQGDQNSLRQCIRRGSELRMVDFGVSGLRHALIEGAPHRLTWGCIRRIPKSLFPAFEEAYRKELAVGCPKAGDIVSFREAMMNAGARWNIFHIISRVPEAIGRDRPRGEASLRQQVLAWLTGFIEMSEEFARFPALGQASREVALRLRSTWPRKTHDIPPFRAFQDIK